MAILFVELGPFPTAVVKLRLLFLAGLEGKQKSGGFALGEVLIESFLASQRFYLSLRSLSCSTCLTLVLRLAQLVGNIVPASVGNRSLWKSVTFPIYSIGFPN